MSEFMVFDAGRIYETASVDKHLRVLHIRVNRLRGCGTSFTGAGVIQSAIIGKMSAAELPVAAHGCPGGECHFRLKTCYIARFKTLKPVYCRSGSGIRTEPSSC